MRATVRFPPPVGIEGRAALIGSRCDCAVVPISSRIGQVFIPVRDAAAAADWYAKLLGIEPGEITHHGTICDIPTEGEVRLALDSNRPEFATDGPPRFFWWADDLEDVRRHLESIQASDIGEITDIGSVAFLQFRDPDGSPLMVCSELGH